MGKYVARLLTRQPKDAVADKVRPVGEPFGYHDKGSMATSGRSKAVATLAGLEFGDWPAWIAWLGCI